MNHPGEVRGVDRSPQTCTSPRTLKLCGAGGQDAAAVGAAPRPASRSPTPLLMSARPQQEPAGPTKESEPHWVPGPRLRLLGLFVLLVQLLQIARKEVYMTTLATDPP